MVVQEVNVNAQRIRIDRDYVVGEAPVNQRAVPIVVQGLLSWVAAHWMVAAWPSFKLPKRSVYLSA